MLKKKLTPMHSNVNKPSYETIKLVNVFILCRINKRNYEVECNVKVNAEIKDLKIHNTVLQTTICKQKEKNRSTGLLKPNIQY